MGAQLRSLSLFLLLLLTLQEMVPSEAAMCQAPSRFFDGLCFNNKNCAAICEKDGFISGECKWFKCVCEKDCNSGRGGSGEVPPSPGRGGEPGGDGPPSPVGGGGGGGGEEPGDGPSPSPGGGGEGSGPALGGGGGAGEEPGEGPSPAPGGGGGGGEDPDEGPSPSPGGGGGGDEGSSPALHSRKYLLHAW